MIFEIIILISVIAVFVFFARHLPEIKSKFKNTNFDVFNKTENIKKEETQEPKKAKGFFNLNTKNELEQGLDEADKLLKEHKFKEAENSYIKLASLYPKEAKIYNRIGILYLEQNNFEDAKLAFKEAIKIDDKIGSRWYNLALAQMGLKEYRSAINSLVNAIKLENKNDKYLSTLKDVRNRLKKIQPINK